MRGREVHWYFHLLDRTLVLTASLVGRKDKMEQRTVSGRLLIPSSVSNGFDSPGHFSFFNRGGEALPSGSTILPGNGVKRELFS